MASIPQVDSTRNLSAERVSRQAGIELFFEH
jgi:hypothetical protein